MITILDSTRTKLTDFDINLLPEAAFQYLKVHKYRYDDKAVTIEAGPYAGLISLLNGESLYIAPRIGSIGFSRMLSVVNNIETKDGPDLSEVGTQDANPVDWLNIVGQNLRSQLLVIDSQGLRFDNYRRSTTSPLSKGKVNHRRTELNLARHYGQPVVSQVTQKTYSTPENLVLSTAAKIVNHLLFANEDRALTKWSKLSGGKQLTVNDYETVVKNLNRGHYDDYRGYYIPALKAALLLLPNNVAGLDFNSTGVKSTPFMTNINLLYEEYIRSLITKHLLIKGYITEKPQQSLLSLFSDGTYRLVPDVLITKKSKAVAIGDMKYKPREETAGQDYYQLKTYMDAYNLKSGFLVRPTPPLGNTHTTTRRYFDGKTAYDISMDLSDFEKSEQFLLEQLNVVMA